MTNGIRGTLNEDTDYDEPAVSIGGGEIEGSKYKVEHPPDRGTIAVRFGGRTVEYSIEDMVIHAYELALMESDGGDGDAE